MNHIEVGTRVWVSFSDDSGYKAELIGRPQGVGDTFIFRQDDGRISEINPNASSFEGITEEKPAA